MSHYWEKYNTISYGKKKEEEEPKDIKIDKTYFKLNGDGGGDGNQGKSNVTTNPIIRKEAEAFVDRLLNSDPMQYNQNEIEEMIKKTVRRMQEDLGPKRVNVKRKFRF